MIKAKLKTIFNTQIPLADSSCNLIIDNFKLYNGINKYYYCNNSTSKSADWKIIISKFDKKATSQKITYLKSKFFHSYCIKEKSNIAHFFYRQDILFTSRFYFILKCLILDLFIRKEILFLHASGVKKGDEALIFTASAHRGKSTIARLSKLPILADDGIILKKIKNAYYAFTSPFEKKKGINYDFEKTRVGKIYLLQRSKKNLISNTRKQKAFKKIYTNLLVNKWAVRKIDKNLVSLIFDLLSTVKVESLFFNKDPKFLINI